jgi:hypothetical protein
MTSEEIIAKIKEKEEAYKKASEEGNIYFPFYQTEQELKGLNLELAFTRMRERADWYEFMIPKKEVLIIIDEEWAKLK